MRPLRLLVAAACLGSLLAGCQSSDRGEVVASTTPVDEVTSDQPEPEARTPDVDLAQREADPAPDLGSAQPRPDWLGTRVLPLRPDGIGEIRPTPPELVDRRFPPPDDHPLPRPDSEGFRAEVRPVPDDVLARSTWHESCPVGVDDLRYITLTFWGFDDRPHTGELLVHRDIADELVTVFRRAYEARFPIEEMRVVRAEELDLPPTGDGNNTTAFVCRRTVEGQRWSEHAYGLAVDINPFHNPYARGDVVIPELASAYVDRGNDRPGMIQRADAVHRAFAELGWDWGGDWRRAKDWMHFSRDGG
jgi:hypothetical protein